MSHIAVVLPKVSAGEKSAQYETQVQYAACAQYAAVFKAYAGLYP